MRVARRMSQFFCIVLLLLTCGALSAQNQQHRIRNIVLVHGVWASGSGWKGVYDILVKDGYNVSIVQEPETSFKEDVAATKRVLAQEDGPSILVAHSYGGAIITEVGTDPSVVGLVYIAAHMPDAGEKESDDGKRFPSDLAKSGAIKKTPDGFTYVDLAQFHDGALSPNPKQEIPETPEARIQRFKDVALAEIKIKYGIGDVDDRFIRAAPTADKFS
jgi:pimeloyl-ACP methyl ester carboxylesterase